MNKKLTAKIQKLVPMLGEKEMVFSSSIAIEPPERDLILKKGNVYTVFDVKSTIPLNIGLLTNVLNDVLFESYYHSDNVSPIQSLEKAIVNINEKLSVLGKETANDGLQEGEPPHDMQLNFNILAGVLWGNVLYIVQYGNGKSFLMRAGEIKEVSATSEGKFSVASGVVNSDDVIVLSTEDFANKFPPERLLSTALSSNDLEPSQSSMILKFMVDSEFTDNEIIDFNLPNEKKSSKISKVIEIIKSKKLKREKKVKPIETLADMSIINDPTPQPVQQPQQITPAPTLQSSPMPQRPNVKIKSKLGANPNAKARIAMLTVAILLVISIFVTVVIKNNNADSTNTKKQDSSSLTLPTELNKPEAPKPMDTKNNEEPTANIEVQLKEDQKNNLIRLEATPFYDIHLADDNANPNGIAIFSNTIAVTDSVSGKVFTSDIATPKFTALEGTYVGIRNALNFDGKLNFIDNTGFKVLDLGENKITKEYNETFGISGVYLGNIYSVKDGVLTKYVTSGEELSNNVWAESDALINVNALDIAYSIYTTTSDGALNVFTSGEQGEFEITGLNPKLKKPVDIEADANFDYIYVADAGENRVVILKNDGELVRQIKAKDNMMWDDLKAISVNADESVLYVLSGSKVYDIDLKEALAPFETETEESVVTTDSTADTIEGETNPEDTTDAEEPQAGE